MGGRFAGDAEVAQWRENGWALLDGLIGTDEIDAALADLALIFPSAEEYHADPAGTVRHWRGVPPTRGDGGFVWPPTGPGFRPEQHAWRKEFPFPGSGALNRLCVHPTIVEFCARALGTPDIRIYQSAVSAKYTGETNYEQPMHTDRNHSWLPSIPGRTWGHVEGFLYLSDVHAGNAPTHMVDVPRAAGRDTTVPLIWPTSDPEIYAAERAAAGPRGSYLAYRSDVFHRAVDLTEPGAVRYLLNVSFKVAGCDWLGFYTAHSRANTLEWGAFVEGSTPSELALFGFPPPGDPVWDAELLDATATRYPGLDLGPWRSALA
ncbi:MAG TPA: hypothetical protein VFA84_02035 [Acidimicrobiales bacterium]|nr:hypothetical protein [Acidimicrobiales bacterium]